MTPTVLTVGEAAVNLTIGEPFAILTIGFGPSSVLTLDPAESLPITGGGGPLFDDPSNINWMG